MMPNSSSIFHPNECHGSIMPSACLMAPMLVVLAWFQGRCYRRNSVVYLFILLLFSPSKGKSFVIFFFLSFINKVELHQITDIHTSGDTRYRTWEIGYWIGKDHWGKGVTTSAVECFSSWAFSTFPDLLRLEAGVYEGNHASMRVLERAGYKMEGISRQAVFKNGKIHDVHNYALLRSDIEESK